MPEGQAARSGRHWTVYDVDENVVAEADLPRDFDSLPRAIIWALRVREQLGLPKVILEDAERRRRVLEDDHYFPGPGPLDPAKGGWRPA